LAVLTARTIGAIHQFAGIDTATGNAGFAAWTGDFRAGISLTIAIDAEHATGTFEVATEQPTGPLIADHASRTRCAIIGYTVTIIVFAIADLWLRLRRVTAYPLAILTGFFASTTRAVTCSEQAIID
jgi:hypothetical protein